MFSVEKSLFPQISIRLLCQQTKSFRNDGRFFEMPFCESGDSKCDHEEMFSRTYKKAPYGKIDSAKCLLPNEAIALYTRHSFLTLLFLLHVAEQQHTCKPTVRGFRATPRAGFRCSLLIVHSNLLFFPATCTRMNPHAGVVCRRGPALFPS